MYPARQGFRSAKLSGGTVDLRLIVRPEFTGVKTCLDIALELLALDRTVEHFTCKPDNVIIIL